MANNGVCEVCGVFKGALLGDQLGGYICQDCHDAKNNAINAPPHYIFGPYEVIDVLRAWLDVNKVSPYEGALWFSLMQYAFRYKRKKGLQDLKKAEFYLDKLIGEWEK